jgi:phytoene dehydrogenase-like protein
MSDRSIDTIVLGAGANGLAAALALVRAGTRTLLLEAEDAVGGRDRPVEFAPGFRAAPLGQDSGWIPEGIARAVGWSGSPAAAQGPGLAVALSPGEFLSLPPDPVRAAEHLRPHSARDAETWASFIARQRRLAGMLEAIESSPAPDVSVSRPGEIVRALELAWRFRSLGRSDMTEFLRTLPISIWELLDDAFESDALKAAVATAGIEHHAQGPRSNGTGFLFLHQLTGASAGVVRGRGAWGAGATGFIRACDAAARAAGAEIRTGARVERVVVEGDRVAGVVLEGGEEIRARRVLSTADPAHTLLRWVDPVWLDPEFLLAVRNVRHRGCTAFVLYALDAAPEFPGLPDPHALAGTVSLSPSLPGIERAADAAKYGEVPETPHVEITLPSARDPDLAGRGGHVLVARAHYVPYRLRGGAVWSAAGSEGLADRVSRQIETFSPGFSGRVRHRQCWSPGDLERRFGYPEGAATGGELGLDQILFMRPVAGWSGYATPIAGLYLGGVGSHPGPGILGGAGWLAAHRMLADSRD